MSALVPSNAARRALAVVLLAAGSLAVGGPAVHAQPSGADGPSDDQLIRALPDSLSGMTRTETGPWQRPFVHALFERTSGAGPITIDVRLAYGRRAQSKVQSLFRREGADTTTTESGQTVYTVLGNILGDKSADLLWTEGGYTLWMSARPPAGASFSPEQAHAELRAILTGRLSVDQLPEVE